MRIEHGVPGIRPLEFHQVPRGGRGELLEEIANLEAHADTLTLRSPSGYHLCNARREGNYMTDLLKKAFDAVSALPPERQNALAHLRHQKM
jgi:hypothetical protein